MNASVRDLTQLAVACGGKPVLIAAGGTGGHVFRVYPLLKLCVAWGSRLFGWVRHGG